METKMIRVPFEIELAKRIQNKEQEGIIVTKRGDNVRIVCFDVRGKAPILALIDKEDREGFQGYDERGKIPAYEYNELELMIEIPEYMTFKDGDVIGFGENNVGVFKSIQLENKTFSSYVTLFGDTLCFYEPAWVLKNAHIANKEEKQKLIDALKASKDPISKECLKKLGIDVKQEYEFRPKDWVLCRASENDEWSLCIFSHKSEKYNGYVVIGGIVYKDCIPYNDSTKHLLGTTENYE